MVFENSGVMFRTSAKDISTSDDSFQFFDRKESTQNPPKKVGKTGFDLIEELRCQQDSTRMVEEEKCIEISSWQAAS